MNVLLSQNSNARRAVARRVFLTLFWIIVIVLCPVFLAADTTKKNDPWLPYAERVKIWDSVVAEKKGMPIAPKAPKPYSISKTGLEAAYEHQGIFWTITGANAPVVSPTEYPQEWPVKGSVPELVVIPEPVSNTKILPFTQNIGQETTIQSMEISGAADSYEPASFVIRSGDRELKNVTINISELKATVKDHSGKPKTAVFPRDMIDVRVVKCWYQARDALNDTRHKMLKAELLLHDDNLVAVDYDRQLNYIRDYASIRDTDTLKPFTLPHRQNKQVWITAHITDHITPGLYTGSVTVQANGRPLKPLKISIRVHPFVLPKPMIDYALYYEGYLAEELPATPEARKKSRVQMIQDLNDMKEHGLTNATLWHQFSPDRTKWLDDLQRLKETLAIRREIGWGTQPLLYLDWKNIGKESLPLYQDKVREIIATARSFGIKEVYIYGGDEKTGNEFAAIRPLYEAVHAAGAKNFVAMTETTYVQHNGKELIDIPIFWGIPGIHMKQVEKLAQAGATIWKYSSPQAGLEEPETYRRVYGLQLLLNGFSGACNYQYQIGSWNDFFDPNGRPKVMAYPTMSKPVPTLQWEGWRKGVDDVRYATLMKQQGTYNPEWLRKNCATDLSACRTRMVQKISERPANRGTHD